MRKMTRQDYQTMFPYRGMFPPMKCVNDVIRILEGITESASKNSNASSIFKARAAMAAEVLGELAIYMLTTHIEAEWSEASFARLVTRHFEKCGTTLESLTDLHNIFVVSRQLNASDESR